MNHNPFDDDAPPARINPFGDDDAGGGDPAMRVEQAARKIRGLRSQLGAEGLSVPAMRDLIDEVAAGLEAAARALKRGP
jgi:hypothetical protein